MCSCDVEYPQVSSTVFRKARKAHTCDDCDRRIEPGEQYRLDKCLLDGDLDQNKACIDCQILLWWVEHQADCSCVNFGTLYDDLSNSDDLIYEWEGGVRTFEVVPDGFYADGNSLKALPWMRTLYEVEQERQRQSWDGRTAEQRRERLSREVDRAIATS